MTSSALYPTFRVPTSVAARQAAVPQVQYRPSYRFDFVRGEFVLDGSGRVVLAEPYLAWVQWCAKAAVTERGAYLIHDRRYGAELEAAMRQGRRDVAEALLRRTITEALLFDPRTRSVSLFTFAWAGDHLTVTFLAEPTVGTAQRVEVSLA